MSRANTVTQARPVRKSEREEQAVTPHPPAQEASPGIRGFVDVIRPFQVRGWAWDAGSPDEPLSVEVRLDGATVATGTADLFRDDLLEAGYGHGRHGFVLNLDTPLLHDPAAAIEVRARGRVGDPVDLAVILAPEFLSIETIEATADPNCRIEGYFRVIEPFEVRGWAVDRNFPEEHLKIEVIQAGQRFGEVSADLVRADLAELLGGTGDHGFVFHADAGQALQGRDLQVRAISSSGDVALQGALEPGTISADAETQALLQGLSFPGMAVDDDQHPVFILGAARSGTSAMAQALMHATRYEGFGEGHLWDMVGPLLDVVSRHYAHWGYLDDTLAAAVPETFMRQGIQHVLVEVARTLYPQGWWLDKTPRPAMISCAPVLKKIWPRARFIFMKRRPIENLASRARKFAAQSFEQHCEDWAVSMRQWVEVRGQLSGVAIEIDQLTLARESAAVGEALKSFLRLESREAEALAQALETDRPERTAQRFAATYSADELGWSAAERQIFERVCGPAMAEYGYAMGPEYFRAGEQRQGLVRL